MLTQRMTKEAIGESQSLFVQGFMLTPQISDAVQAVVSQSLFVQGFMLTQG